MGTRNVLNDLKLHSPIGSCNFERHILKAGLDPGPWTLDSGLWTLGFFPLKTLFPTRKKPLYLPPRRKPLYIPPKNLCISPMKLPPPPINISSFKYSVRVFKQTTLFPPTHLPEKTFMSPP